MTKRILLLHKQISNVRWMPNSVNKGFDTAKRKGLSRQFTTSKPTIYVSSMYVFFKLPSLFSKEKGLSSFILIHSSERWHETHIGVVGVS